MPFSFVSHQAAQEQVSRGQYIDEYVHAARAKDHAVFIIGPANAPIIVVIPIGGDGRLSLRFGIPTLTQSRRQAVAVSRPITREISLIRIRCIAEIAHVVLQIAPRVINRSRERTVVVDSLRTSKHGSIRDIPPHDDAIRPGPRPICIRATRISRMAKADAVADFVVSNASKIHAHEVDRGCRGGDALFASRGPE